MKFTDTLLGVSETPSYLINFFYWHNDWLRTFINTHFGPLYEKYSIDVLNNSSRNDLLMSCFVICEGKSREELMLAVETSMKSCVPYEQMDKAHYDNGFL